MNFLFTAAFALLMSACGTENQSIDEELESIKYRGEENQDKTAYLEFEFHQAFLVWEEQQIRDEIVRIEELIERKGEGYELLEQQQQNLERNRMDYQLNEELYDRFFRGPIGGVRPGRPCGSEPDPNLVCPIPRRHLGRIFLYSENWADGRIEILTAEDEVCGEMIGMEPVSGGEEQFLQAIIEFDEAAATQIRFTKVSANGSLFSYTLPLI